MKRLLPLLLTFTLLLSGCKNRSETPFERLRTELDAAGTLSVVASLRAEDDDASFSFRLHCAEEDGGWRVTVLAPEEIRGLSALLSEEGTSLSFEELTLDCGSFGSGALSPMTGLPLLIGAIKEGYLSSAWSENGEAAAEYELSDSLRAQVWLDGAGRPCRAELSENGRVRLFITIEKWS